MQRDVRGPSLHSHQTPRERAPPAAQREYCSGTPRLVLGGWWRRWERCGGAGLRAGRTHPGSWRGQYKLNNSLPLCLTARAFPPPTPTPDP